MALGTENSPYQQSYSANSQKQCRQRLIAPAPVHSSSYAPYQKPQSTTCYNGTTLDSDNPSVIRRNARERNRVKQVNNGFLNLRQHIPQAIVADLSNGRRGIGPGANKKLSKVDTLKMAVEYIRRLQRVIENVDSGDDATSVSSYGSNSCSSSMVSASPSPTPSSSSNCGAVPATSSFYQSEYMPLSYSGSFPQDQYTYPMQHQQTTMISPAGSTTSSACSSDSLYHQPTSAAHYQMKFEHCFDDYQQQQQQPFNDSGSTVEDEELLDYISLWQEDV